MTRYTRGRRAILALCVASTLVAGLHGSTPTTKPEDVGLSTARLARVTQLMQRHIDARTFSGAVTLVARHGRIAHFEAQGLMDLESRKPMQKDTVFRIMSMTKPIVALSILMLVEDGKVRLTDPVAKFIPELQTLTVVVPNAGGQSAPAPSGAVSAPSPTRTVPADRPITVRDLLTHTAGLMSGGASSASAQEVAIKPGESLAQVMPRLAKAPLDFQPGTRWAYSGQYGFDVLARVVEVASGVSFDAFTRQRIFEPLGMKDTSFYPAKGIPALPRSIEARTARCARSPMAPSSTAHTSRAAAGCPVPPRTTCSSRWCCSTAESSMGSGWSAAAPCS